MRCIVYRCFAGFCSLGVPDLCRHIRLFVRRLRDGADFARRLAVTSWLTIEGQDHYARRCTVMGWSNKREIDHAAGSSELEPA